MKMNVNFVLYICMMPYSIIETIAKAREERPPLKIKMQNNLFYFSVAILKFVEEHIRI